MAKHDATWCEIDPSTLEGEQARAYEAYRVLRRQAAAAKEAFERTMSGEVPAGMRMIFGYNFGKLSVAVVEDDRKVSKPKQAKLSLSEYLAQQAAR